MFGIPGLDPLGAVHTGFALVVMLLGLAVVIMTKGTASHRRIGMAYVFGMLVVNGTALMIYDLFPRWGPFHTLAIVSLATTFAGVVPVWLRRPRHRWLDMHARLMSWSYAGLVGAFVGEIGSRIAGVGPFGVTVAGIGVMVLAAVIIHRRVPRIILTVASRDLQATVLPRGAGQ